jgi:hypothetical protein
MTTPIESTAPESMNGLTSHEPLFIERTDASDRTIINAIEVSEQTGCPVNAMSELRAIFPDKTDDEIRSVNRHELIKRGYVFVNVVGGGEKPVFSGTISIEGEDRDLSKKCFLTREEMEALSRECRSSADPEELRIEVVADMEAYLQGFANAIDIYDKLLEVPTEAGFQMSKWFREAIAAPLLGLHKYRETMIEDAGGFSKLRRGRLINQNPFLEDDFVINSNVDAFIGSSGTHSPRMNTLTYLMAKHGLDQLGGLGDQRYITYEQYKSIAYSNRPDSHTQPVSVEDLRKVAEIEEDFYCQHGITNNFLYNPMIVEATDPAGIPHSPSEEIRKQIVDDIIQLIYRQSETAVDISAKAELLLGAVKLARRIKGGYLPLEGDVSRILLVSEDYATVLVNEARMRLKQLIKEDKTFTIEDQVRMRGLY